MNRKNIVTLALIVLFGSKIMDAYNICNNANVPILVIVVESERKGEMCLQGMGWRGGCWDFAIGQTKACTFPPRSDSWLIPGDPQMDVFSRPEQYIALHKIAPQGSCGRYSWRDIEKNFERRDFEKLYFMVFERFKQKSAPRIHFLTAGYHSAKSTITFSGSADTQWILTEKQ